MLRFTGFIDRRQPTNGANIGVLKEAKKIRVTKKSLSDSRGILTFTPLPGNSILRRLLVFTAVLPLIVILIMIGRTGGAGAEPGGELQSRAEAVRSEIAVLNSEMEAKVENYNHASSELERIEISIQENQTRLEEATANLKIFQERLNERIADIYRSGDVEIIDVLMDANDLSEFLTNFDMLSKIGEQDKNNVEQVKMLKVQIEEAKAQLDADHVNQASLVAQLESEKAEIEAGLAQRKEMLTGLESEIAALDAQEEAAQQAAFESEMAAGGGNGDYGSAPAASAGGVVGIAMQYQGVPYVWGGTSPSGFDCSGLVQYVYRQAGYSLPRTAAAQYGAGTPISYSELAPGDLVFFGYGSITHVGIYIGGGSMIHAPFEGTVVTIAPVSGGGSFMGAVRV